jgi:hypothetical protein
MDLQNLVAGQNPNSPATVELGHITVDQLFPLIHLSGKHQGNAAGSESKTVLLLQEQYFTVGILSAGGHRRGGSGSGSTHDNQGAGMRHAPLSRVYYFLM